MYPRVSLSAQSQLALTHQLEQGAGRGEDDDVWANLVEVRGGEGSQHGCGVVLPQRRKVGRAAIHGQTFTHPPGGRCPCPWDQL